MAATVWFPAPTASGALYEHRRRRGLSRPQLAAASGVSIRTLARLERGEGGPPMRVTLEALADALDVPIAALEPYE